MTTSSASLHRLNDAQLYLLKLFEHPISEKQLSDIRQLITDYLAKQVDQLSDQVWNENDMNEAKINQMLNMHMRTPYKRP